MSQKNTALGASDVIFGDALYIETFKLLQHCKIFNNCRCKVEGKMRTSSEEENCLLWLFTFDNKFSYSQAYWKFFFFILNSDNLIWYHKIIVFLLNYPPCLLWIVYQWKTDFYFSLTHLHLRLHLVLKVVAETDYDMEHFQSRKKQIPIS